MLVLFVCMWAGDTAMAQLTSETQQPIKEKWIFQTEDRVYGTPVISGNLIIIGSGDGKIYGIEKSNGKQVWSFTTGGAVHSSPVVAQGIVFAGSADGNLYALNLSTGKMIWTFMSKGEKMQDMWDYYLSSPVIQGNSVLWGSGDGHLYSIDIHKGEVLWSFNTDAIIHATPVVNADTVYIGDYNGNFFALNAHKGSLLWQFRTIGDTYFPRGEIQKGATLENGIIYFGSRDYNIYALNATTGRGSWNMKETGSWIIATPLIFNDNIYFGTSDTHRFYCLDKNNGRVKWHIPVPMRVYGSAVAHNNIIYFGCFDGKVYGIDPSTGKTVWEYQTRGSRSNYSKVYTAEGTFRDDFELYGKNYIESERILHTLGSVLSTPIIEDGHMYFGSSDGGVYCVKLID